MTTSHFRPKISLFLTIALLLNVLSCNKKNEFSEVPYAMVNIELGVYNELSDIGPGRYIMIYPGTNMNQIRLHNPYSNIDYTTAGTFTGKGLILYHYPAGGDQEWMAYDNTCTYLPQTDNAAVQIEVDTINGKPVTSENFFVCPKCKSRFLILDGSPQSGSKAPRPLKQYKCVFDAGTSNIMIYN